jgi:hypothetical protein
MSVFACRLLYKNSFIGPPTLGFSGTPLSRVWHDFGIPHRVYRQQREQAMVLQIFHGVYLVVFLRKLGFSCDTRA